MKKILFIILVLIFNVCPAQAVLIDITDPSLAHFGDFPHVNTPGNYSNISKDFTIDGDGGDFGWHYSPSNHGSSIAGILLGPNSYAVTSLRFEIHTNPFKDFLLQGSTSTTNGFDGIWDTLLTSTVTERTELAVQSWNFNNNNLYSTYRIHVLNDYTGEGSGWAMYRWELLADEVELPVIPEPLTILLFGIGFLGTIGLRNGKT